MNIRIWHGLGAAALLVSGSLSTAAQAASACEQLPASELDTDARPVTIPAVQQWNKGNGTYTLVAGRRVVANTPLAALAGRFASELSASTGASIGTATGDTPTPAAGDIQLQLANCNAALGSEGYAISVGRSITITAGSEAGLFYGTRTLLQLLRQRSTVAQGEIRDWPVSAERGLMIDIGRKYFTPQWLEARIRDMADLKMNLLHLHLSDNEGFRVQSERYPEITSVPALSKDELRALLALAEQNHIVVVPEIDMPGHLGAVLSKYPQYALKDTRGQIDTTKLDISNEAARAFAQSLIEEFIPLFPGPYWHVGGDEYLSKKDEGRYPQLQAYAASRYGAGATERDAIQDFHNFTIGIAAAGGKQARIWNDDLAPGPHVATVSSAIVEWWTDISPLGNATPPLPGTVIDWGHPIVNCGWFPNYIVTLPYALILQPSMKDAYEKWAPNIFYGLRPSSPRAVIGKPAETRPLGEPAQRGAKLHLWFDFDNETEAQVATKLRERIRVLAHKDWGADNLTARYIDFLPLIERVGSPVQVPPPTPAGPARTGDAPRSP